jgi:flagella basal body P-ring formation protein FlgA
MRQVTNSPLTLHSLSCSVRSSVQAIPRALDWTDGTRLTPIRLHQGDCSALSRALLDMPYPLRSISRSRLGEGSVRRLSALYSIALIVTIFLLGPHVSVRAEGIGPETDALSRAARSYISGQTGWREEEIEIRSIVPLGEVGIPSGDVSYRVSGSATINTFRGLILPMEVLIDGKHVQTFWAKTDVRVVSKLVQAVRRLPFGSLVGEDDIKAAPVEVTNPRMEYIRNSELAVGKVLRRTLLPGDPLTRDSLTNPVLVRSGETVRLFLQKGPVTLAAIARAEQDGKIGQVIRVRNLDFSRSVRAQVTGRGEVTIE